MPLCNSYNKMLYYYSVISFTFLGLTPVPVELGKIAAFFLKLGNIINQNSEEKNGIERLF